MLCFLCGGMRVVFFWCILGGFTNSLLQEGETSVTVASALLRVPVVRGYSPYVVRARTLLSRGGDHPYCY